MPSKTALLLSCAFVTAFAGSAFAQERANEIEELVVTAEKREQSLQDVPVAISAFTDERREIFGINSIQDLTNFTPGLAYNTGNDRAFLRGIGRFTNNRSSEGGVAMYNDGFFTSSVTDFARSSIFLERTEVLRGPQGTLYGKNAIGGALNVISKRPTDEFFAEVRAGAGNYGYTSGEAAISGPLFGSTRGRLVGSYNHYGKGALENLNPNGLDEGNRGAIWTAEAQLDGRITDRFEWWMKATTTEWHGLGRGPGGRQGTSYGLRDVTTPVVGTRPNTAFGLSPQLPGNTCQLCFDTDDGNYIDLEYNQFALNVTFHADGFDVKYITGHTYYDYRLHTDVDATSRQAPFLLPLPAQTGPVPRPAESVVVFPRTTNDYKEEVWWFSHELNIASTHQGPLQWLLGIYQFREGSNQSATDARLPDDARFASPTNQTGAPVAPNPLRNFAYGLQESASESYAAFGQADWQATEEIKITAGVRYTYDRKRAFESARLLCIYASASCPVSRLTNRPVDITGASTAAGLGYTVLPGGAIVIDPSVVGGVGGIYTDPTTGLRHRTLRNSWSAVTGTLGADWKPNPDTLIYAKYSRGYKAGGFNAGTPTLTPFATTDKETIDAFELGAKATFAGRLQANVSAFYYEYQDIQVPIAAFNPLTNANVVQFLNIPKARTIGLEVETIWQPIDNLQVLANYAYLNPELRDACCFADPEDPLNLQPGDPVVNGLKDLSGNSLPQSTPHRVTVNVNYTWENVGPGSLTASASYIWRSATYHDLFENYWNRAKSFGITDFRVLYNTDNGKVTVIGSIKNVFDQRGPVTSSGSRVSSGPNVGFVNRNIGYVLPRQYSVELQLRY